MGILDSWMSRECGAALVRVHLNRFWWMNSSLDDFSPFRDYRPRYFSLISNALFHCSSDTFVRWGCDVIWLSLLYARIFLLFLPPFSISRINAPVFSTGELSPWRHCRRHFTLCIRDRPTASTFRGCCSPFVIIPHYRRRVVLEMVSIVVRARVLCAGGHWFGTTFVHVSPSPLPLYLSTQQEAKRVPSVKSGIKYGEDGNWLPYIGMSWLKEQRLTIVISTKVFSKLTLLTQTRFGYQSLKIMPLKLVEYWRKERFRRRSEKVT